MTKISNYKKYANEILDDIQTYELVLKGKIKYFPKGFWAKPWSYESSANITRYLLEKKLKLNIEDIPKVISTKTFRENKLGAMLEMLYNASPIAAIDNAYPNRFKPWEFKNKSNSFWIKDTNNIKYAMRWLIEEKLKWSRQDIIDNYCSETLRYNCLRGILNHYNHYDALNIAYPGEFKPWELRRVDTGYWKDKNNIKNAMRWLIEEKLKWSYKDIKSYYTRDILVENGLSTLLVLHGAYECINIAYPGVFKYDDFRETLSRRNTN